MKRVNLKVLLILFAVILGGGSALAQPAWNHNSSDVIGPGLWGELTPDFRTCGSIIQGFEGFQETGKRQSPVNIVNPTLISLDPLIFRYKETPLVVENNGHAVEVPYERGSFLNTGSRNYQLIQFHVHAPSEHAVNGRRADAELHLVHRDSLGDLAVVGILMNVGPNPNPVFDRIMANAPATVGEKIVPGALINVNNLLPRSKGYYLYSGSLTTPPCTEGVRWQVLKTPVQVSQSAVDRLHQIIASFPEYNGFARNNRPMRPLNGRRIFASIEP